MGGRVSTLIVFDQEVVVRAALVFATSHTVPLVDVPSHARPVAPSRRGDQIEERHRDGRQVVWAAMVDTSAMSALVTGSAHIGREYRVLHAVPVQTSTGRLNVDVNC